jgi:hypothetical protein
MELTLKRLIVVGSFLIDRELTKGDIKRLNRHNLDELWSALRPILRSVCETEGWDPIPSEDEEGIEAYLHQLTEIDPDSQATRYPISTNGQKSLRGVTHINIGVFSELMERLAACLNRIDTELAALRQSKNEFLAEYSTGP